MATNAPAFTAWLDDFFASYYRRRPVNATFIGVHEFDERLPDLSEQAVNDTVAEMETSLRLLRELPSEQLTGAEALDRRLAEGFLEIQCWESASDHFQRGNPSLYVGEAAFAVIGLFLRDYAPIGRRFDAAVARMEAIPTLLAQGRANVRRAPTAWTARAIRECGGAIAFLRGGIDRLIHDHGIDGASARAAADAAVTSVADFQHYLESELRARPSEHYACGGVAFELLLRSGHFLEQGAAAIEAYAQEKLDEAQSRLDGHAAEFGAGTWRDALARLADHHPAAQDYYARFGEIWDDGREAVVSQHLLTWPDYPIRYIPQPEWARECAPWLYFLPYRSPPAFGAVSPIEYLVTPIWPEMESAEQERLLRANNDSVIKLNHVVHHGGLGHHVQNWHAHRSESRIGQIAAVDCASRIAMFCGGTMAEGWACYATDLMHEIGFLTPLERYAEHHTRLRMAARALVDVRLHHGVWSLEDATAFYRDEVGLAPDAAHAEAVKNSMFPGAAMMYLSGTDLIHGLRRDLAARHGAAFDLRRFHDRFLSYGSVPVTLIARAMLQEPGDE